MDLLVPVKISDTNRRLYHFMQYDTFRTIQILTQTGISLNDIRNLLKTDSADKLTRTLKEQERILRYALQYLQGTIIHMDNLQILRNLCLSPDVNEPLVIHLEKPQNYLASLCHHPLQEPKAFLSDISQHINTCETNNIYPFPLGLVIKNKNPLSAKHKYCLLTSAYHTGHSDNRTLVQPAGQYIALQHRGSLDTIIDSVDKLKQFGLSHFSQCLDDVFITVYNDSASFNQTTLYFIQIRVYS